MRETIILNVFCAICGLAALGMAAAAVISGQIGAEGLDGLFLVLVCLLIASAFFVIPLQAVRKGLLRELLSRRAPKPADTKEPKAATAGKSEEVIR